MAIGVRSRGEPRGAGGELPVRLRGRRQTGARSTQKGGEEPEILLPHGTGDRGHGDDGAVFQSLYLSMSMSLEV